MLLQIHAGRHVKYLNSCETLITLEFSQYILSKSSNMKFHKISSNGSRVVSCGRTDGQTGMSKLLYIHGSVHRDSVLIRSSKMQQYARIYLLQVYSTRFGRPSRPSSGVQKTVTAASGTGHSNGGTTFLQRGLIRPRWR